MYRGDPLPLGIGQIASKSPAGWIRRMGNARSACAGSTTQALGEVGKNALTAMRPAPRMVDLVRTKQLKWILMSAFNQLTYRIQRHCRSHANLLESKMRPWP